MDGFDCCVCVLRTTPLKLKEADGTIATSCLFSLLLSLLGHSARLPQRVSCVRVLDRLWVFEHALMCWRFTCRAFKPTACQSIHNGCMTRTTCLAQCFVHTTLASPSSIPMQFTSFLLTLPFTSTSPLACFLCSLMTCACHRRMQ